MLPEMKRGADLSPPRILPTERRPGGSQFD